jgi:hypothetical protein
MKQLLIIGKASQLTLGAIKGMEIRLGGPRPGGLL